MNLEQCGAINAERLGSWGALLTKHHSTAFVLIGVGHDHVSGTIRVILPQDFREEDARKLLLAALFKMDKGEVETT